MKLDDWLSQNKVDHRQFAEKIKCAPETVRRYIKCDRVPTANVMRRIAKVTAFQVTANDFFNIDSCKCAADSLAAQSPKRAITKDLGEAA